MSLKIAADNFPTLPGAGEMENLVVVREYDERRDKVAVEEMERRCEVGQRGKPSLVTDLMGDPICRVRNFPSHVMLVAECGGGGGEIVGAVRACVKTVTKESSGYVKLAYILGLRVSPSHRRLGIGTKLVQEIEEWCKQKGADYSYMATDCSNEPSINLFTRKFSYTKFRTLTMLVQPVHAHYKPLGSDIAIIQLTPKLAEAIYCRVFASAEFFPKDIGSILHSKLNLGHVHGRAQKSSPEVGSKNRNSALEFCLTKCVEHQGSVQVTSEGSVQINVRMLRRN
ncbi:N-ACETYLTRANSFERASE [Salix viminalis]|uniref:N-ACETYLTRANSFERASE n=1 Tax=Salix viminalis TaxID=40686 RepID=A0A9Q0TLN4_SALVM|nr:N-ACETYLTRANSFERASE [Salix viminalis]